MFNDNHSSVTLFARTSDGRMHHVDIGCYPSTIDDAVLIEIDTDPGEDRAVRVYVNESVATTVARETSVPPPTPLERIRVALMANHAALVEIVTERIVHLGSLNEWDHDDIWGVVYQLANVANCLGLPDINDDPSEFYRDAAREYRRLGNLIGPDDLDGES